MAPAAKRPPAKPRLSAQERRAQIMDSAAKLILQRGLSHCTLEEVATTAGISKALIYRHFSGRDELLVELLEREYSVLRGRGLGSFSPDVPFEHVVRVATLKTFEYLHERGAIFRELASDRATQQLLQPHDREERMASTRFFVEKSMRTYGLPAEVAQIIAVITINAPLSAARGLRKFGFSPQVSADVWTEFVLAGWQAVGKRFGTGVVPVLPKRHTENPKPTRRTPIKR